MPISAGWFLRSQTAATATGTTSLSIAVPTGTTNDDILVMVLAHKGTDWAVVPAGWTLIQRDLSGATRGELYWKRASGEAGPYSITGLATVAAGAIAAYGGGLLSGDVVNVSSVRANASGTNGGSAAVTSTHARALVICGTAVGANVSDITMETEANAANLALGPADPNIAYLERFAQVGTAGIDVALHHGQQRLAGTTGQPRASASIAAENVGLLAVLIPETAASSAGTNYYLARQYPGTAVYGELEGDWDSTWNSPEAYSAFFTVHRLSQYRSDAGWLSTRTVDTNVADSDVLLFRALTPPLQAQTISGTVDLVALVSQVFEDRNLGPITCDVYWRLHIYVTQGESTTPRATLLDKLVDTNAFPFSTRTGHMLSAAAALTSQACEAGDCVMVELGVHVGTIAQPTPTRPPQDYAEVKIQLGTQRSAESYAFAPAYPDAVDGGTATGGGYLAFSHTFLEQTPTAYPGTNTSCGAATAIASLPYDSGEIDVTQVPTPGRTVWWSWTATFSGVVIAHTLGSYMGVELSVHESCTTGAIAGVTQREYQNETSLSCVVFEAETGVTYYLRARQSQSLGGNAPSSGGVLRIGLIRHQALANDDVLVASSGYIARYRGAQLVDLQPDFAGQRLSGLAIDYSRTPLADLNGGTNTSERLYVGVQDGYVEILDLETLNKGQSEIDLISDPIPTYVSNNWEDGGLGNLGSLALTPSGTLVLGFWGNGFTRIAGNQSSYLVAAATTNSANLCTIDATHADNQPGAPFAAVTRRAAALDVAGIGYVEMAADQATAFYTSGGWYVPIGGTLVKRYDVSAGSQGADFATLAAGSGPNPGPKGLYPLPDGGVLVCNGDSVVRLNSAGTLVQTYTPNVALRRMSLADVELTSDETAFWVLDQASTTLYKFDLASGSQLIDNWTYLGYGSSTSIVVYRVGPPEPTYTTEEILTRRLRRAPHLSDEQQILFYSQLQIDLQAGMGLASGQGSDPLLMLRYSDDGGHTWSDVITVGAGRMGEYKARAIFRRLGRSRDRVFEVSVSDPIAWFLVDAYLAFEKGIS